MYVMESGEMDLILQDNHEVDMHAQVIKNHHGLVGVKRKVHGTVNVMIHRNIQERLNYLSIIMDYCKLGNQRRFNIANASFMLV